MGKPADGEAAALLTDAATASRVRGILALGGVPWDQLDDGLQHVRLKLLEARAAPGAQDIRDPRAWLAVVASRVACDWHRGRAHDEALRERLVSRWARRPPDVSEEHRVLAIAVAGEPDSLSLLQRQMVSLRFYADLPVSTIAELLEIPEGTVKSRLHSTVAALRRRLQEKEVI
ncbi:RNA polymerase sigma factor [Streptomyces microflavus]|uniref:RNA polymerase sigma factor n=1 Tax=Streptomyces microflavus TaxID=1919 RepID=UPI0033A25C7D